MSEALSPEIDALPISAPVSSVTLLEDRARVIRRGTIELAKSGRCQLLVSGVAPVLVDKTLVVKLVADGASVADARVIRRLVPEASATEATSERDQLVLELRERRTTEARLRAEAQLIDAEADGLHRLATATLGELADDVSRGRGFGDATMGELAPLAARERSLRAAAVVAWHDINTFAKATERLERRIHALSTPSSTRWCGLVIDLDVSTPGSASLEIEYVAPAAMWRPSHIATLSAEGGGHVATLETTACVWQTTGEDWTDAELFFSTERASLGAEPPPISTDLLRVQKRADQLVVETREQEIQALSGRGESPQVSHDLPGIDDGGQIVSLASGAPVSVPSDGRPHRIPIGSFSAPVDVKLWAYPELSSAVVFQTVMSNRGEPPVLAGPVELVRDGGWVGRTSVGYVAPGEEFEISWGPEPSLRASREATDAKEESRALSSWISRERKVIVRVSNLGRESLALAVRERVPVSEIEKVKIEIDKRDITDGVMPDDDGFVTWELTVPAHSRKQLELRYTLKRHSDVVGV